MLDAPIPDRPSETADEVPEVTETLPVFDNGYFDALVAIGFAALADSYFDTAGTPLIKRRPTGFAVTYTRTPRQQPNLGWLRYSVAGGWKGEDWFKEGWTLVKDVDFIDEKQEGARRSYEALIPDEGVAKDTSGDTMVSVKVGNKTYSRPEPIRQLYSILNKFADATWLNLCIYSCRHEETAMALLEDNFEEEKITFNSAVLPQSSKGANSSSSFSIGNASLSKTISRRLSRSTCLAVAGLIRTAIGDIAEGFAIPVPRHMRIGDLTRIANGNRRRLVNGGFFFPFDNYLNFLKLLVTYIEEEQIQADPKSLSSVTGASFVELGNAPSPSGSWQLTIPNHEYTISSVEQLQTLLYQWKKAKTAKPGRDPSVDRAAVRRLMRGFERSDPLDAAEGYLAYVFDVGLRRKEGNREVTYTPLTQPFFEEIMSHTYSDLLQECQSEEVRKFIDLVRRETYNTIYPSEKQRAINYQKKVQPNYQMMRKLREVQDKEDFMQALTEIAMERGMKRIALEKSDSEEKEFLAMPYEPSISKLVELAEKHDPRLIAQLVLSLALCKRPGEEDGGNDDSTKAVEEATVRE